MVIYCPYYIRYITKIYILKSLWGVSWTPSMWVRGLEVKYQINSKYLIPINLEKFRYDKILKNNQQWHASYHKSINPFTYKKYQVSV